MEDLLFYIFIATTLYAAAWFAFVKLYDVLRRISIELHGPDVLSKPFDDNDASS